VRHPDAVEAIREAEAKKNMDKDDSAVLEEQGYAGCSDPRPKAGPPGE
jgi:hypothetical protein